MHGRMILNQRLFSQLHCSKDFVNGWYAQMVSLRFILSILARLVRHSMVDGLGPPDDVGVCDLDCCNARHSCA